MIFDRERFPDAVIQCVDASESMLAAAKESHRDLQGIEYTLANFESFDPKQPVDVIYSNAALHWVSFDVHRTLLPRLVSYLKPGFPCVSVLNPNAWQAAFLPFKCPTRESNRATFSWAKLPTTSALTSRACAG